MFKQRNIPYKWKDYFIFVRLTGTLEFWICTRHLKFIGVTVLVRWKIHLAQHLAFNNSHSWRLRSIWGWDGVMLPLSLSFQQFPNWQLPQWYHVYPTLHHLLDHILNPSKLVASKRISGHKFLNLIMHNTKKFFFSFNINCLSDRFISCTLVYVLWIVNNHSLKTSPMSFRMV